MKRRYRIVLIILVALLVLAMAGVLVRRSATYQAWRYQRETDRLRAIIADARAHGRPTQTYPSLELMLSLSTEQARRAAYPRLLPFEELDASQQATFRRLLATFPGVAPARRKDLVPVGLSISHMGLTFVVSLDGKRTSSTMGF